MIKEKFQMFEIMEKKLGNNLKTTISRHGQDSEIQIIWDDTNYIQCNNETMTYRNDFDYLAINRNV